MQLFSADPTIVLFFFKCLFWPPKVGKPTLKSCSEFLKSTFFPYSRLLNKHRGTLINFWIFFQGLRSLLERVMHIFFKIFAIWWYGGCLFQELRLMSLPNVPGAMFIPGAKSIPESRVSQLYLTCGPQCLVYTLG